MREDEFDPTEVGAAPSTRSVSPTAAVSSAIYEFVTTLDRYRASEAQELGLSTTDVVALIELARNPGMRPSDLTRAVGLGVAGTTSVIDKLARAGFARRVPDPADRRSQNLFLTPAGEHAAGWLADRSNRVVGRALAHHTPADMASLAAALTRLTEAAGDASS